MTNGIFVGRKKKSNNYFTQEHENALIEYVKSDIKSDKDKIYREMLDEPFRRLTEAIIRTYFKDGVKGEDYEQTFNDGMSYIFQQLPNFNPDLGYKGYSYFGTILLRYVINRRKDLKKKTVRESSYENHQWELMQRDDLTYTIDDNSEINYKEYTTKLALKLEEFITATNLNDDEVRVGHALIFIFENWDNLIAEMTTSKKYNKNYIQHLINEISGVDRKKINQSLKRYKKLNHGFIKLFNE